MLHGIKGTLCIIDTAPRPPLPASHRSALITLAAMVSDQLASRLQSKRLQVMYGELEKFKQMVDHVPAMVYAYTSDEKNANPRFPIVSKGAQAVYGISPDEIVADAGALVRMIHPDDMPSFVASIKHSWEHLEQCEPSTAFHSLPQAFRTPSTAFHPPWPSTTFHQVRAAAS